MSGLSPAMEDEGSEEEEDMSDVACLNKPGISAEQDIRLLIREIHRLQENVQSIQSAVIGRCKGPHKATVLRIVRQLGELQHILDGQLYRADKLIH
jgi:hypothetical protein